MYVKQSNSVNSFKNNLEKFKNECLVVHDDNYLQVSAMIIDKIEGNSQYLMKKKKFNEYLLDNPYVTQVP